MKIPTPRLCSKLAGLALLAAVGCAGGAAEAPFPARPDSVSPGDLAGPFQGRVIDAASGKPIEGASVLASWAWESGSGMRGPAAARAILAETDSDGEYAIDRLRDLAPARGRLERFTLVVYQRGYVAWRSDRRYEDDTPRHDFAQSGNIARLDKLPADASHVRHLRFVGAAGPLLPRLAWEIQQAGLELEAQAKPKEPAEEKKPEPVGPLLDASVLLSADELKAVTGFLGEFAVGKLTDLPTTATYDSLHFRAEGKPETFDAALRVFKLDAATAERQYGVLVKELPGAVEKNEIGDRSLRAREGDIYAVAALDRARGVVLVFTCGAQQCKDLDSTAAIVKRMWSRLGKLGEAAATPAGPAEKAPEAKP